MVPQVVPQRLIVSLLGSMMGMLLTGSALAGPVGGTVSAGNATIAGQGSTSVTITQNSQRVVIDWNSFDTNTGETVMFNQINSNAIALNRVLSGPPTQFNGNLKANGKVILMNSNGIVFGQTAKVDVSGLVATSANISNDDFMNQNKPVLNIAGSPDAAIINNGQITINEAGLAGFVAPNVVNNGVITAYLGQVHLAAADTATVDFYGDGLVNLAVDRDTQHMLAANTGVISASGGVVQLTAKAARKVVDSIVLNTGVIEATSVAERNGKIILYAEGSNAIQGNSIEAKKQKTGSSTVINSGLLDVSGLNEGETGGTIAVLGDHVSMDDGSLLAASGDTGGGKIYIGGNYLGMSDTPTALTTYVGENALILNDAITSGDGGKTIVWSDDTTWFYGSIFGRGGDLSGNGGFVETSGKINLDAQGYVDLTAAQGKKGTYLLDPADITIYGNFAPTDIAGSQLWLDAKQITGLNNGDAITTWYDQSGNGNNATNGTSTSYSTNGLNGQATVNFGTTSQLTAPTFSVGSIFMVGKSNNANFLAYEGILGGPVTDPGNGHILNGWVGTTGIYQAGNSNFYQAWQNGAVATNSLFSNINAASGWIGSFVTNTPISTNSKIWIGNISGGARGWNGQISELIVYSAPLTNAQRNLVEQYQSSKWGIGLSAPGTGVTEADKAMSATGYNVFTTRYLEQLSATADISLLATNTITLDLKGDTLNLANDKSLSLTTTNGNISSVSAGTLQTTHTASGGNVTIVAGGTGAVSLNNVAINAQGGGVVSVSAGGATSLGVVTGGTINVTSGTGSNIHLSGALTATKSGAGDHIVLDSGLNFINTGGSINPGTGRYLIYSANPANNTLGGITATTKRYNKTYSGYAPGTVTETGNVLLYSIAPVITVTADDQTKIYGDNNPTLTASYSGAIDGDTISTALSGDPSITTSATSTTGVSSSTITASVGTLTSALGYTFNYINGVLSITAAPLTVTADSKVKTVGDLNPALTLSFSGLKNGDPTSVFNGYSLDTIADINSGAGNYLITLMGGSAGANYTVTRVNGNLTVDASAAPGNPTPVILPTIEVGRTTSIETVSSQLSDILSNSPSLAVASILGLNDNGFYNVNVTEAQIDTNGTNQFDNAANYKVFLTKELLKQLGI